MRKIITGLFANHEDATHAIAAIKDLGIDDTDISIVANAEDAQHEVTGEAKTGIGVGAVIGGVGGLLTGLGALVLPGVGPIVATGWLLSMLGVTAAGAMTGGAVGGLIGALTHSGIPEVDAHVYADALRRGGALISVRADKDDEQQIAEIFQLASRVYIDERQDIANRDGWLEVDDGASLPSGEIDTPEYPYKEPKAHP